MDRGADGVAESDTTECMCTHTHTHTHTQHSLMLCEQQVGLTLERIHQTLN